MRCSSTEPLVIPDDRVAWLDADGTFEVTLRPPCPGGRQPSRRMAYARDYSTRTSARRY
jgi:hypothetical protein